MYVEVRFVLTTPCTVVLENVHAMGTKSPGGCMRNVSHETVQGLDLAAFNVQDRFTMHFRNDKHRAAFVLALINLGYRVVILGNNRAFARAR